MAPNLALWGLLHDAAEAYLGDLPTPLKGHLGDFRDREKTLLAVIVAKYGLEPDEPASVKDADRAMLIVERQVLMAGNLRWPGDGRSPPAITADPADIKKWDPSTATDEFMTRFHELYDGPN